MIRITAATLCLFLSIAGNAESGPEKIVGYTEPVRIAQAAFSEFGVLDSLLVAEGDAVKAGSVLAVLDQGTLPNDLNISREQHRLQKLRLTRLEKLREDGGISVEEYERASADSLIASQRVERVRAQIDARTLRAPFDGVILRVFREVSESVTASQPDVLTIGQLDRLHLVVHVPASMIALIGEVSTIEVLLENQFKEGAEVVFVSPVTDAASQTVRIKLLINNSRGKYRSGMKAEMLLPAENATEPVIVGEEGKALENDTTEIDN